MVLSVLKRYCKECRAYSSLTGCTRCVCGMEMSGHKWTSVVVMKTMQGGWLAYLGLIV
jgi:hypothetical protein